MTREEAFKKLEQTIGLYLMSGNADDTYCGEWREILETLKQESKTDEDCISRQAVEGKLKALVNEMETIFADIRESKVDDSVCGLCEYDCDHGIDGYANECPGFERDDCFKLKDEYRKEWESINELPSVQQEPKTGHWAETRYRSYDPKSCETYDDGIGFRCSNCANVFKVTSLARYHYCPNCGCRMESEG